MGKLIVTNNENWKNRIVEEMCEVGFALSGVDSELATFYKLNVKNYNYYKDGDAVVATAGTFIYREKLGEEALKSFLDDVKRVKIDSILELRKNALGMYVVALKLNGVLYIFVDDESIYQFFYYLKEKDFFATDTLFHVGQVTGASFKTKEMQNYISVRGYYGRNTYFENTYKLSKDEIIIIDNGSIEIRKSKQIVHLTADETFDEVASTIEEKLRYITSVRKKLFNKSILFLTGGVDSRLEYSMYIANDENVDVGYWLGKDRATNGRIEDANISKMMAEMYGKEFKLFDLSEDINVGFDAIDKKMCNKYGEWAGLFANNTKYKGIFENLDTNIDFINFGAMGEPLKDDYSFDKLYTRPYSIDKFIQDDFCGYNIAEYLFNQDSSSIYESIKNDIIDSFVTPEMDTEDLTYADCSRLVAEKWYVLENWASQFANMFAYSFPTLGMREVHDIAVSMNYNYKSGSKMVIELIGRFCDKLLDVPFFSRHCYAKLNRKTGKIRSSVFSRIRRKIIPVFMDSWFFQKVVVDIIGHIIWPDMKYDESIYDCCDKYLKESKTVISQGLKVSKPASMMHVDILCYTQTVSFFLTMDQL